MVTALDPLRQLDLLRRSQEVHLADVLQEELQRIRRDVRPLDLERIVGGFLLVRDDDLDVELLEHAVELVDLAGIEGQLLERDCDLVGREAAGLAARLQKLPGLVAYEDGSRRPSTCCCLLPSGQLGSPSGPTVVAHCYGVNVLFKAAAVFQIGSVPVYRPEDSSFGP